jgi:hypothetical protein
MPGSLQTDYTFSVLQVFAVVLQKSYRSQVGLHCTIISLRWEYPLKMVVCHCLYTHYGRGPRIFQLSNRHLWTLGARNMTKQVPYWAPQLWSDRSHYLLFGASCHACELNAFFKYKGQNCNNYAEDIGCCYTKLSYLPLTGCLGCMNPCVLVWTVKHLTALPLFYDTQFTFPATLHLRN